MDSMRNLFNLNDDSEINMTSQPGGGRTNQSASRSRGRVPSDNAREPPKASDDLKQLDLSKDEIESKKAFIWACGKNTDGELGFGNQDSTNLP